MTRTISQYVAGIITATTGMPIPSQVQKSSVCWYWLCRKELTNTFGGVPMSVPMPPMVAL